MDQGDPEDLTSLFEDLEQQAAGLELAERDAELADRVRGEYAAVTLADRVHASLGRRVTLVLVGGEIVEGVVLDAGRDWLVAGRRPDAGAWLVPLVAVALAHGLSDRSLPEAARPVTARLGFGAALHRWAEEPADLRLHLDSGRLGVAAVLRIGADFVEVDPGGGGPRAVVATRGIRAVWRG